MQRRPEPELMNEVAQAIAYDEADFEAPNARFVELFETHVPINGTKTHILDLGCGPADIPFRLVARWAHLHIDAVDGAPEMLERARHRMALKPTGHERLRLVEQCLPINALPEAAYDIILSNSLLHHLHDPMVLWRDILRWGRAGAYVLVVDLRRPNNEEEARALLAQYGQGEPEVLQRDFYNSLLAAFTPEEIKAQLQALDLDFDVDVISDRHVMIHGHLPG